jgi:hypothetical protein
VGTVEIACSNSVIVTIPPIDENNYPDHFPDEGDAFGWVVIFGLIIIMLISISVVFGIRLWREIHYKKTI